MSDSDCYHVTTSVDGPVLCSVYRAARVKCAACVWVGFNYMLFGMREGWFNYVLFRMKTEEGQCPFVAVGAQRPRVPCWYGRIGEAGNVTAFRIGEGVPHCVPCW